MEVRFTPLSPTPKIEVLKNGIIKCNGQEYKVKIETEENELPGDEAIAKVIAELLNQSQEEKEIIYKDLSKTIITNEGILTDQSKEKEPVKIQTFDQSFTKITQLAIEIIKNTSVISHTPIEKKDLSNAEKTKPSEVKPSEVKIGIKSLGDRVSRTTPNNPTTAKSKQEKVIFNTKTLKTITKEPVKKEPVKNESIKKEPDEFDRWNLISFDDIKAKISEINEDDVGSKKLHLDEHNKLSTIERKTGFTSRAGRAGTSPQSQEVIKGILLKIDHLSRQCNTMTPSVTIKKMEENFKNLKTAKNIITILQTSKNDWIQGVLTHSTGLPILLKSVNTTLNNPKIIELMLNKISSVREVALNPLNSLDSLEDIELLLTNLNSAENALGLIKHSPINDPSLQNKREQLEKWEDMPIAKTQINMQTMIRTIALELKKIQQKGIPETNVKLEENLKTLNQIQRVQEEININNWCKNTLEKDSRLKQKFSILAHNKQNQEILENTKKFMHTQIKSTLTEKNIMENSEIVEKGLDSINKTVLAIKSSPWIIETLKVNKNTLGAFLTDDILAKNILRDLEIPLNNIITNAFFKLGSPYEENDQTSPEEINVQREHLKKSGTILKKIGENEWVKTIYNGDDSIQKTFNALFKSIENFDKKIGKKEFFDQILGKNKVLVNEKNLEPEVLRTQFLRNYRTYFTTDELFIQLKTHFDYTKTLMEQISEKKPDAQGNITIRLNFKNETVNKNKIIDDIKHTQREILLTCNEWLEDPFINCGQKSNAELENLLKQITEKIDESSHLKRALISILQLTSQPDKVEKVRFKQEEVSEARKKRLRDRVTLSKPTITPDRYQPQKNTNFIQQIVALTRGELKEKQRQQLLQDFSASLFTTDAFLLSQIQSREFTEAKFTQKDKCPNISKMAEASTNLTNFIIFSLLLPTQAKGAKKIRAKAIEFYIDLASKCLEQGNFSSSLAIFSAINSPTIERLTEIFGAISEKKRKILTKLADVFNYSSNYKNLRPKINEFSKTDNIYIPPLEITLKDYDKTNSLPSFSEEKVNLNKVVGLHEIISSIERPQKMIAEKAHIEEKKDDFKPTFDILGVINTKKENLTKVLNDVKLKTKADFKEIEQEMTKMDETESSFQTFLSNLSKRIQKPSLSQK